VKRWGFETALDDFLASEAAGGLVLMVVAALALVVANSPLAPAYAGVSFAGIKAATLVAPVTIGVAFGLFFGKQLGVFAFAWAAIRMKWAEMPSHASWTQLYGVALLCGIGFTTSLFIGLLAFPDSELLPDRVKIGVLGGSLCSALVGALLLRMARPSVRAVGTGPVRD
jgi:NhaA family Na+:H+ antiporter